MFERILIETAKTEHQRAMAAVNDLAALRPRHHMVRHRLAGAFRVSRRPTLVRAPSPAYDPAPVG